MSILSDLDQVRKLTGFGGSYLFNLSQLRRIEWGRTYTWDIRFPDAPAPFNAFFPATDVSEPVATLQWTAQNYFLDVYRFPHNKLQKDLRISFLDDQNGTLLSWLKNWIEVTIFNQGKAVSPIGTQGVCKRVLISKLDSYRNIVKTSSYLVFPEGIIDYIGGSQSDHVTYTVNFVVAGDIGTKEDLITSITSYASQFVTDPGYAITQTVSELMGTENGFYSYDVNPSTSQSTFPSQAVLKNTWGETMTFNLNMVKENLVTAAAGLTGFSATNPSSRVAINRCSSNVTTIGNKVGGISTQVTSLGDRANRKGVSQNVSTQANALSSIATKVNSLGIKTIGGQLTGMSSRLSALAKL